MGRRIKRAPALQVGPESAGAHPGPVCYRKPGGLPALTDANLALGRILPVRPCNPSRQLLRPHRPSCSPHRSEAVGTLEGAVLDCCAGVLPAHFWLQRGSASGC